MNKEKEYMREAIALATANVDNGGGPFGAVIVKDGVIVGRGVNRVTANNDPTAHAEVSAIRDATKKLNTFDLHGCEIYTSCEPCPMCLGAIYWARIKHIYYGNTQKEAADIDFDDSFIYKEIEKGIGNRTIPETHLLGEEAIDTFNRWRDKADKIEY